VAASGVALQPGPAPAGAAAPAPAPVGATGGGWRLVARYTAGGQPVVILADGSGRLRTLTPADIRFGVGEDVSVAFSDTPGRVAPWSGDLANNNKQGAVK
jgi:hypothetical protein